MADSQIKDQSFLEDIGSLLNTGEIPNLFTGDDVVEIMEVILVSVVEVFKWRPAGRSGRPGTEMAHEDTETNNFY